MSYKTKGYVHLLQAQKLQVSTKNQTQEVSYSFAHVLASDGYGLCCD